MRVSGIEYVTGKEIEPEEFDHARLQRIPGWNEYWRVARLSFPDSHRDYVAAVVLRYLRSDLKPMTRLFALTMGFSSPSAFRRDRHLHEAWGLKPADLSPPWKSSSKSLEFM